ncbi:ATP-binding protein [Halorutilales archaeon Cl-col2-1]
MTSSSVLLPMAPVWIVDIVGSVLMMVFAAACVVEGRKFSRKVSGAIGTYILWMSYVFALFAFSRSVGHILRRVLVTAGRTRLWESVSPVSGGLNSLTFIVVATLTLYYQKVKEHSDSLRREIERRRETEEELRRHRENLEEVVRRRTEDLRRSKRRYEDLFNSISDPVFVHEVGDGFLDANDAAVEKLGYSREELLSMSPEDVTADLEKSPEEITAEIDEKGELLFEASVIHRDGNETPVLIHSSTTQYDGTDAVLSIARDVTEVKEREKQLKVLDRVLRHNMHSEMNVVLGYARIIRERSSGEVRDEAAKIIETAEGLIETTDKEKEIVDVLSEDKKSTVFGVDTLLEGRIQTLRDRYPDYEVVCDAPSDSVGVRSIPEIGKAIDELIGNAAEYNDSDSPRIEVSVSARPSEDCVEITVADNGPGIPDEEVRILTAETEIQPLYHGSGLGLWLVHHIVERSGGSLRFEENQPRGSIVRMRLPSANNSS